MGFHSGEVLEQAELFSIIPNDRKQIGDFLAWGGCEGLPTEGYKEGPEVMKMFYILIEVMATRVFTLSKLIEL